MYKPNKRDFPGGNCGQGCQNEQNMGDAREMERILRIPVVIIPGH
jgi:hypothetical protein